MTIQPLSTSSSSLERASSLHSESSFVQVELPTPQTTTDLPPVSIPSSNLFNSISQSFTKIFSPKTAAKQLLLKAATEKNWDAFHPNKNPWKNDPEIMGACIKINGEAINYAGRTLQCDQKLVLLAATTYPTALALYGDDTLKNDPDIMLPLIQQNPAFITCAGPVITNDPEIMVPLIQQQILNSKEGHPDVQALLPMIDEEAFSQDPTTHSIQTNISFLHYAGPHITNNPDIMMAFIEENPSLMRYAGPSIINDPNITNNPSVMVPMINQDISLAKYAGSTIMDDKVLIESILTNYFNAGFVDIPSCLQTEKYHDILFKLISHYSKALEHADDLRSHPEFMIKIIQKNPNVGKYLHPSLLSNPDFMLKAIQLDPRLAKYIDPSLKQNTTFLNAIFVVNYEAFNRIGLSDTEKFHLKIYGYK